MQKLIKKLVVKNDSKIVLLVMDGLGGLPAEDGPHKGKTELEAAHTPNMDALAKISACGLHTPVRAAITPGSGPGHLAIFGYDPIEYQIGRGILEALGLGLEIRNTDIALRCNYATIENNIITDRRAGRVATEQSRLLTEKIASNIKDIDGVAVTFSPGMEHRFAVRFRFNSPLKPGASAINDTDPQKTGIAPLKPVGATEEAKPVAAMAERLALKMADVLKSEPKANYALMRGFSQLPHMPTFEEAYGLRALAIATYPMYRGVAKLVGMNAVDVHGDIREEIDLLKKHYNEYDFFFIHVKKIDSYGEDGNFEAKMKKIEEVDKFLPEITALKPDALIITGDHSTPALIKGHSWHPVPVLLSARYVLGGMCESFGERQCHKGELGVFNSIELLPLAMANAGRLNKFGA